MPRIARVVVPEYPHHVTQRGTNKATVFKDKKDYQYFLKLLDECSERSKSGIWAYCLMENHFHLLIAPYESKGLGGCLHGTTFRYAQYFNIKYSRSGRLWQNRYFSCPVDKDEYLWAVVKYIEMNPVRAGIVKKPEDWIWSSAREHLRGHTDNNIKLYNWLKEEERKDFAEMMIEKSQEEKVRKATSSGRPLCGESFYDKLEEMLNRRLKPNRAGRPRKQGG